MSRRAPPNLSERDVAEIEAFAQLLDLQAARRAPDAIPWALDVAEAALYPGGVDGDEPPRPVARPVGQRAVDRAVCLLTRKRGRVPAH